ncbi:MAG: FHA domain-containing protein, partial [Chloroflexi bacterium]
MARFLIYDVVDTDQIIEAFDLLLPRLLIGSALDNDLVLDAPGVDPNHASLELRHDHWVLQDLGGPAGTRVNHRPIAGPYRLRHGDLVEIGPVRLQFEDEEGAGLEDDAGESEDSAAEEAAELRGRVWFAGVAGFTLLVILVVIILLVIADYL